MEKLRKERSIARSLFTKAKNDFEANLESHIDEVTAAFGRLQLRADNLFHVDERVKEQWLNADEMSEDQFLEDCLTSDKYQYDWERAKVQYDNVSRKIERIKRSGGSSGGSDVSNNTVKSQHGCNRSTCSSACQSRRFRLPKIELRKFDGNVKNWIGFWGQFKKIDSDESMDDEDKFQYLYQCTLPESPARELVESFPPSGANYRKAIEQLKARFARDDLLIEIYVRELLNLVLSQAKGSITSYNLGHLYDKLNTQLQALQSLGVTVDKYAALLFPLVESALPESVLRAWERSQVSTENKEDHLNQLMQFLKREVESEERIQLARSGITSGDNSTSVPTQPTAACLVSTEDSGKKNSCIWCEKASHSSFECYKANKMTYEARKEALTKKGGCFICLKTGHNAKRCKNYSKCLFCSKRHSILMCPDVKTPNKSDNEKNVKTGTSSVNNNVTQSKACTTLLQTFMVKIMNDNKCVKVRTIVDTGAQRSYLRRDIIEDLGLKPVCKEIISHCLFGGIATEKQTFNTYEFSVASTDKQFQYKMTALDKSTICGYVPRLTLNHAMINELQKHNITLSDIGNEAAPDIGLLIGADYAGLLLTDSFIRFDNNVVAIKTKLGWTLQGPIINACSVMNNVISANLQLTDLWDLETLGIRDPAEVASRAKADSFIMDQFRDSIKINDDRRYEVDLPWKPGHGELLDNKRIAEKRLMTTTQKLLKLNEFDNYSQVFNEWLSLGIIEEVDGEARSKHYLSHHAVIKDSSLTTRVRPVFDASARDTNGNSLNSFLEKGINCLELIPKLLIKFRKHAIGITSDIKKAFLQISLKKEDRDYLSFLWWKTNETNDIITYRYCRVVFGLTSSPFLLGATINYHLEKYTDERKDTAEKLKKSFYVDNCVTSVETESEARRFIDESKAIMSEAKFELRGWITAPMTNEEMTEKEESLSVLGLMWDLKSDQLYCNVNFVHRTALNENITKRSLLSITQKVFDPIGLACPVTLVPKLIIQKTWNMKLSWDKELPADLQKEYHEWSKHIHLLNECRIPRRLTSDTITECQNSLHVFCDASKLSFAASIFLRSERHEEVSVQLVQARSRVAPVREVTIPRLELMAALIGTRLYIQVKEALDLPNCPVYFWTDASVAFTWITTEGDWNIFVKNRVKEIRQHTKVEEWHHLPGTMNPADLPSRGCNAKHLLRSKWWEGPEWLKAKESEWPVSQLEIDEQEVNKERKKVVLANNTTEISTFLLDLTYFSKYTMIVRMVGWILRFAYNCRNKDDKRKGELSCEEFQSAEKLVLKMVQTEMMTDAVKKKTKDLKIFKDEEGLLRIRTKLLLSDEPADFVCPIYLPAKHPVVVRLVESKHRLLKHAGSNTLMAALREGYWIAGARRLISSTISRCIPCKRQSVKHAAAPLPPLPRDRIEPVSAFEVSGIDLAGPLFLRSGGKVWIILFTCAVYRAVHLELTRSLSTEAFLVALRRFVTKRGRPLIIYTDNGTNFHGANNLMKSLNWKEIELYSSIRRIKWKFSPPAAPWWGGWWERLFRSLKELLRRNLGQRIVSYEELDTLLCECESLMNARPLTYVADNSEYLKPLTPAHFMRRPAGLQTNETQDLDQIDSESLNRRLRYLQKLREDLRERFRNEYLGMLIQKGKERSTLLKEHHLQRAICTGLIIPTPEVCDVQDLEFYERCYPPDYKMPKQHIHMQPLWQEQEAPEYDIDSEDERWLKQQRHPELTELKFEQMMDKLEKSSGQTVVTLNEAKLLLERHDDLVIAVYDYWLNKRLKTQHPLILSVKTESRPGQSSNNPYLAFRRRTEKMQTRKNRKNDESSYEKMLKLRRELARALSLLELVARREKAKRELLRLTAAIAERRYHAGDFTEQPRPVVPVTVLRREYVCAPHYPPRAPPTPVDQPRQREKRPYKRRKHRHHAPGSAQGLREPAFLSSSEEEGARAAPAPPPDDGPFAFRRKPGCYYEMPTSTLCGDPVDPDDKDTLFEHEIDERHRFNLTSINFPYRHCVGFARLRRGRGGRLALDRVRTPLDTLWTELPPARDRALMDQEMDLETRVHRTPKEITRDYHSSGKYPWRHAFRKHLAANPELWIKTDPDHSPDIREQKPDVKQLPEKCDANLEKCKDEPMDVDVKSDISVRTIDSVVRENLEEVLRKRAYSSCSSDGDSDSSLYPVEKEFQEFINEVDKKWLHFRPKTPPPSPPYLPSPEDRVPVEADTPLCVELHDGTAPFTTGEFSLGSLMPQLPDPPLDFTGLTDDQVESILSDTDLKSLSDDKKLGSELLEQLVEQADKDPFLCHGRGPAARGGSGRHTFGSSYVRVAADTHAVYIEKPQEPAEAAPACAPAPAPAPDPVPAERLIVSEVNEVPQIKLEKKKKDDTIEELQLAHGVQLKTVQTKHSPLKKHIITSAHRRSQPDTPQIRAVAVSDTLKVRLQNHLLSSQAGAVSGAVVGLVQNGPFTAVPSQPGLVTAVGAPSASTSSPRRVGAPLVHLAGVAHKPLQLASPVVVGAVGNNKLKVLHAHPLTHEQRAQLLQARAAGMTPLPAVVSLATLEAKATNTTILKAAPGSVAQFFEIKGGQLGKGPHLVNVVRQPPPKAQVQRVDVADANKRLVATFDGNALKSGVGAQRAHRVSLSLDGRQLVRAALPPVRPQLVRHQIQLKGRRDRPHQQPTISIAAPTKTASIPSSVVANLLQKNVSLSAPRLIPPAAGVQAIAFSAAQLKARQSRLLPARPTDELSESTATTSAAPAPREEDDARNGAVRRPQDTLPMEVT